MLGALKVSLGLDASDFISGMTKSEVQAKKFADSIDRKLAAGIIKAELAINALAAGARTTAHVFQVLTTGAADFKDLEETTGASAESLASLALSAATAGVEMVSVGDAANKLTKNLLGVDDESKAAGAALKALNINIADFKKLDPVSQYEAVGKALGEFGDGAGKVAVAQALFGKSGTEQLKVFKALEEAGGRQTILTQRQIELADSYADAQAKSAATLRLYVQAAATEAIPALTALTEVGTEFVKTLLGVDEKTKKLSANNAVKTFAQEGAIAIATLVENTVFLVKTVSLVGSAFATAIDDVQRLAKASNPLSGGIFTDEGRQAIKDLMAGSTAVTDFNKKLDALANFDRNGMSKRLREMFSAANSGLTGERKDAFSDPRSTLYNTSPKPTLSFDGADTEAAGRLKKQLDGRIKAIRDFADQQRDAFEFANRYVKGTYDDGLISLQQFYATEASIREAGLQAQISALDKERAALQAALPKAKAAERVDLENKIAEVVAKRGEAVQKAGRDGILAAQEEARALQQVRDRYDELRATIANLSGDTAKAARIRIDQQVEEARRTITAAGGDPADADIFRKQLEQQQALGDAQKKYQEILTGLRLSEEQIAIARERGSTSEIEQLVAVGAARRQTIEQMEGVVAAMRAIAESAQDQSLKNNAEEARLALERLKASADPLASKFSGIFENSFSDAFGDFITGSKTASQAFKAFGKSVADDISRLAAKNIGSMLFGENGLFGGAGSGFAQLFGGQQPNYTPGYSTGGGSGFMGALSSVIGTFIGGFGSSGYSVNSTPGDFGTTGVATLPNLLRGGKAIGGPTMPSSLYQVGERKPEVYDDGSRQWLLTGSRRGRIDPSPQFGAGRAMTVTNNFTIQGTPDRRTQSQIAAAAGRGVASANARNN